MFTSTYATALDSGPLFGSLPDEAREATIQSVGATRLIAAELGPDAPSYLSEVSEAFMSGLSVACLVVGAVAGVGSLFAARFLPARAVTPAGDPVLATA